MTAPTEQDPAARLLAQFEALRVAYEKFFAGLERAEPMPARQQLVRDLRQALARPPRNTSQNFRLQAVKARIATYEALWDRTLANKENSSTRG